MTEKYYEWTMLYQKEEGQIFNNLAAFNATLNEIRCYLAVSQEIGKLPYRIYRENSKGIKVKEFLIEHNTWIENL